MVHLYNGILHSRKKDGAPALHSIMLTEISHAIKDKYHMITYMWNLINKTSKQNITRDIELKDELTVIRGEGRGR